MITEQFEIETFISNAALLISLYIIGFANKHLHTVASNYDLLQALF